MRHLDPSQPVSKNRYAVALYDPYIPDVLFGEVLIIPEWTQPSLSAEAIRQNGGVAPPPEPILPSQFTIHLYNPDQDVTVRYKPKSWNSPPTWEFEMPQRSFRQPSSSTLDRTQSDPAASDITPRLKFFWRKDGTLSKDFACYLSGKTTTPDGRKKSKEPDITISIFKGFKEITLYEPNLYRVEMEDFKGLEVVLMLGAVVIRDVFFGSLKEAFHVSGPQKLATTNNDTNGVAAKPQRPQVTIPQDTRPAPALDPRTKWEIEAENARLRQQQEAEERERRRRAEEEERKTMKLLEAEERAARKKQAEIDKETERLKRIYGKEEQEYRQRQAASRPNIKVSSPQTPNHYARYQHGGTQSTVRPQQPHLRPQSSLSFFGQSTAATPHLKEKKSIFGFRKNSDDSNKLSKKRSSMF